MKKALVVFAFAGVALGAQVAVADSFTGWPVDCRPSDVSRRIARQFLSTSPDYYCPTNGYRGNRGYGFGKEIQYSVVSLWINAMECARIIGDAELEKQLVAAFEPYYGPKRHVLPKFARAAEVQARRLHHRGRGAARDRHPHGREARA